MADLDTYLENIGISTQDNDMQAQPAVQKFVDSDVPLIGQATHFLPLEGDARQRCEGLLVHILLHIDPAYAVEVSERHGDDGSLHLDARINGGDIGRLIGKNGRTLTALEYLTYVIINQHETQSIRIHIDAGNYKERQTDRLRHIATQAANRVRKTGFAVELDPMPPADRRLIHMVIADEVGIVSESSGEGRGRRVVIKPTGH